jgi:hypothetical protein
MVTSYLFSVYGYIFSLFSSKYLKWLLGFSFSGVDIFPSTASCLMHRQPSVCPEIHPCNFNVYFSSQTNRTKRPKQQSTHLPSLVAITWWFGSTHNGFYSPATQYPYRVLCGLFSLQSMIYLKLQSHITEILVNLHQCGLFKLKYVLS